MAQTMMTNVGAVFMEVFVTKSMECRSGSASAPADGAGKGPASALGVSVHFNKADVSWLQGEMQAYPVTSDVDRWLES